jgi:hypothetical protein
VCIFHPSSFHFFHFSLSSILGLVSSSCSSIFTVVDQSLSFIYLPSFSSIFSLCHPSFADSSSSAHPISSADILMWSIFLFFHPSFADLSVHPVYYLTFIHLLRFSSNFQFFHECFADSSLCSIQSAQLCLFSSIFQIFIHSQS